MNTPEKSVQLWIDSECDFFDAVLVEHSALYRIDHILTDDADFRFEKIPYVFTANRRLL